MYDEVTKLHLRYRNLILAKVLKLKQISKGDKFIHQKYTNNYQIVYHFEQYRDIAQYA